MTVIELNLSALHGSTPETSEELLLFSVSPYTLFVHLILFKNIIDSERVV